MLILVSNVKQVVKTVVIVWKAVPTIKQASVLITLSLVISAREDTCSPSDLVETKTNVQPVQQGVTTARTESVKNVHQVSSSIY